MKARAPAAVHYRLAPGKVPRVLVMLLGGAGLAHGSAWFWSQQAAPYSSVAFWLAVALSYGGVCWLAWRWQKRLPTGWLVWTGAIWRLQTGAGDASAAPQHADAAYLACDMVVDMQSAVLLRLHTPEVPGAPKNHWVWATRTSAPAHWHALRCALVWAQSGQGNGNLAPEPTGLR